MKLKKQFSISQLALILILVVAIAISAVPGYVSGKWSWADLPKVANIKQLQNIRKAGLSIHSWSTLEQREVSIGGNKWLYQIMQPPGQSFVELLLMPQNYYKNHPQVEWVDLDGIERWTTDSHKTLQLSVAEGESKTVSAQFFRAWNRSTFVVVQWYAWPGGGNYSPFSWFLADQWAQLHRQRASWIAVSLKIPVDPLASVESTETLAKSLAQTVQTTLEKKILTKRQ
ncbi:MAG: cyanoexosortase B system-associated protein [Hydrococcus sp. Prado102]|nr:cyanoexosortase B system-associated protein [Hydrococcus sp. Prado102]